MPTANKSIREGAGAADSKEYGTWALNLYDEFEDKNEKNHIMVHGDSTLRDACHGSKFVDAIQEGSLLLKCRRC